MGKLSAAVCSHVATSSPALGCLKASVATKLIMGHMVQQVKAPRKIMASTAGWRSAPKTRSMSAPATLPPTSISSTMTAAMSGTMSAKARVAVAARVRATHVRVRREVADRQAGAHDDAFGLDRANDHAPLVVYNRLHSASLLPSFCWPLRASRLFCTPWVTVSSGRRWPMMSGLSGS